jgi:hypothetical protein
MLLVNANRSASPVIAASVDHVLGYVSSNVGITSWKQNTSGFSSCIRRMSPLFLEDSFEKFEPYVTVYVALGVEDWVVLEIVCMRGLYRSGCTSSNPLIQSVPGKSKNMYASESSDVAVIRESWRCRHYQAELISGCVPAECRPCMVGENNGLTVGRQPDRGGSWGPFCLRYDQR